MESELTEKRAAGMTVNERLWVSGLVSEFDKAIEDKNEKEFREICRRVFLSEENITVLVNKYLGG